MPFREKVKKALGGTRNSRDDPDSNYPPRRSDIEYYKPHEIPRSKYRGPWNQKHQDSLQAFSFQEATQNRKGSIPASYSPRGTNAMSRRSSWLSKARSSLGSRSDQEGAKTPRRMSQMSHVGPVVEDADDDADVGNGESGAIFAVSERANPLPSWPVETSYHRRTQR